MRGGGVERGAAAWYVSWETDGVVGVSVSFGLASNMRGDGVYTTHTRARLGPSFT